MALKIAVERNSCLRQFWQFLRHFQITVIKLVTLDFWQARNMSTYFFSVFFSKKTETKIMIYAWFDQLLNSSIKIVMHSE